MANLCVGKGGIPMTGVTEVREELIGFDTKESQSAYIRSVLNPSYIESDSGKALIKRMWMWLRGR